MTIFFLLDNLWVCLRHCPSVYSLAKSNLQELGHNRSKFVYYIYIGYIYEINFAMIIQCLKNQDLNNRDPKIKRCNLCFSFK